MFSNGEPLPECDLFVTNPDFKPHGPRDILKFRCENAIGKIRNEFITKKSLQSNLLPTQIAAMGWLKNHPELTVW